MAGRIIGYTVLGVLALILLILLVPVGLSAVYDGKWDVSVRVFGIPFSLTKPKPPKKSGQAPKKETAPSLKPSALSELVKRVSDDIKQNGIEAIKRYIRTVRLLCEERVFTRLLRTVTADKFKLALFITAADASQTALGVGEVCAVLYPAVTTLQNFMKIRKRQVTVTPDFLADTVRFETDIVVHTVPLCFLWALGRAVRIYRKHPFLPKTGEESNNGK